MKLAMLHTDQAYTASPTQVSASLPNTLILVNRVQMGWELQPPLTSQKENFNLWKHRIVKSTKISYIHREVRGLIIFLLQQFFKSLSLKQLNNKSKSPGKG